MAYRYKLTTLGLLSLGFLGIIWIRYWPGDSKELKIPVSSKFTISRTSSHNCTIHTCLDLRKCAIDTENLAVYVQPLLAVFDENGNRQNPEPSANFIELRNIILSSRHNVPTFEEACLILPGIDTLATNRFLSPQHLLRSLDSAASFFPSKPNLLVFNFFGSTAYFGDSIVASSRHLRHTFRRYFDLVVPNPISHRIITSEGISSIKILFPQPYGFQSKTAFIKSLLDDNDVKILSPCLTEATCIGDKVVDYYNTIKDADFIIINEDAIGFDHILRHALECGSIPVFASDMILKPLSELIDWSLISFTFSPTKVNYMVETLLKMEKGQIATMKAAVKSAFNLHFHTMASVVESSLALLEQRLIPNKVLPLSSLQNGDLMNSKKSYIYPSNYYIVGIFHREATSDEKLKWMLRYFLYTQSNASVIMVVTEAPIQHLFEEFLVPPNPTKIHIILVSSVNQLSSILHNFDSHCFAFVVDSSSSSLNLDENLISTGFLVASQFPHRISYLHSTDCSQDPFLCPAFYHTSLLVNNRGVSHPLSENECFSLSSPLNTGNISWISCPFAM